MAHRRVIFKYPLSIMSHQHIMIHGGEQAEFLSVQEQNGQLVLWALVDPTWDLEPYPIIIHGTGQFVEEDTNDIDFIDTVQMGPFVWHVFAYIGREEDWNGDPAPDDESDDESDDDEDA